MGRPHNGGPLPSWNEGAATSAVRDFVALVKTPSATANLS